MKRLKRFFGSIKLTVSLLIALFFLILFATFSQVDLGIFEANKKYFTSWFIWQSTPFGPIPIYFGGMLIGLLLVINLITSHATNFKFKRSYLGIFLIHFGLVLLIVGSAFTSWFADEMQIAIAETKNTNYVEYPTEFDFVLIDASFSDVDQIYSVPIGDIADSEVLSVNDITLSLHAYYPNSIINQRGIVSKKYDEMGYDFKLIPLPMTYKSDEKNIPGMDVTISVDTQPLGRFIFWGGTAIYQELAVNGKNYLMTVRPKREYLPFQLTLNQFTKKEYDRSEIAELYRSNVTVTSEHGNFDTSISMNEPLRHKGYTFFQASFTEDEATSVFQVVRNPSWLIPYISSLLIVIGLFVQMMISMKRGKS